MKGAILVMFIAVIFMVALTLDHNRTIRELAVAERHIATQQQALDQISNISDIQQSLIDRGFEWVTIDGEQKQLRIDGVWGEITDRAYCNYKAIEAIERMKK